MKTSKRFQIIQDSVLVATSGDCQLRQQYNTWWMMGPTGVHSIKEDSLNDRVEAHWKGFVKNNSL